jgi:hypothetical protein
LARTTELLNHRPRGWRDERPPGIKYLKETLNLFDYLGFVSIHYWGMDNELIEWMSPPVAKVWERVRHYVEAEADQRKEPDFYESAKILGESCIEYRRKKGYPPSDFHKGAT